MDITLLRVFLSKGHEHEQYTGGGGLGEGWGGGLRGGVETRNTTTGSIYCKNKFRKGLINNASQHVDSVRIIRIHTQVPDLSFITFTKVGK